MGGEGYVQWTVQSEYHGELIIAFSLTSLRLLNTQWRSFIIDIHLDPNTQWRSLSIDIHPDHNTQRRSLSIDIHPDPNRQ